MEYKIIKMNKKHLIHSICTIMLGVFFIYKGIDKIPVKLKDISAEEIQQTIIEKNSYEAPVGYKITMNTMRQSGFLKLIAFFQIICGILMIIPWTRLIGLLILFPIIFNIFFMHVFFDNRIDENIVTGGILLLTLILCSYYYKRLSKALYLKEGM
tara:strand:- start:1263 stop:1727 length:465 start_codon:yes stop_codon:yes gene_type:complete